MSKTCSCGAEIDFMKMESGAPMPYRPDSKKLRLVRFTRGGRPYGKMVTTYEPHFADCPDADQYKKEE